MNLFCAKVLMCILPAFVLFSEEMAPQVAWNRLMEGNDRFVHDKLTHPDRTPDRREALVSNQTPFGIIVGCADSRVAPEILFDQGVGDLFVVRVAGNVIGPLELDSIDYAALYLKSSVILVLGHQNCGAVDAVIHGKTKDIESVAKLIKPAVEQARKAAPFDLLSLAVKLNAIRMRDYLLASKILKKLVADKKIEIHAGYYQLRTGEVEIL